MDEFILAHSYYGTLVKIQGLINGGWTGRTIYLQFDQGHRQQSNCFHGNPGSSGTPRRQKRLPLDLIRETRNPAWSFTRSNTTTASMPDPVPLHSAPSWLLSPRPGYRHTSTYTPPATTTRQSQTSQVDTGTRLCRWGRRTSEAARNGWHRLSPRNMPCSPCPGVRGGWQGCDSPRPDRNY